MNTEMRECSWENDIHLLYNLPALVHQTNSSASKLMFLVIMFPTKEITSSNVTRLIVEV